MDILSFYMDISYSPLHSAFFKTYPHRNQILNAYEKYIQFDKHTMFYLCSTTPEVRNKSSLESPRAIEAQRNRVPFRTKNGEQDFLILMFMFLFRP